MTSKTIVKKKSNLFNFSKSGIYVITCIKNQKHYIGQSKNVKSRLCAHKNKLRRGIHENLTLQKDFNQYGQNLFLFKNLIFGMGLDENKRIELEMRILLTLPPEQRYNVYINWRKRGNLLNPFFGQTHTLEARQAQSLSKIGKPSPFLNHKHKNKVKKLISKINSGKTTIDRRKPVIIDSIYYESISEASQKTGLNRRLIRERCHNKNYFKNFQWANF